MLKPSETRSRGFLPTAALFVTALLVLPQAWAATLDGNPFNEDFSTNFVAQAGANAANHTLVGPTGNAMLTGGVGWFVGIAHLYDSQPVFDPNAWTGAGGSIINVAFSTPMSVVELYAASTAGATLTAIDPMNGNSVVSIGAGPGGAGRHSFGGYITGLSLAIAGAAGNFASIDSLGFSAVPPAPVPVPAALPLLLSAAASLGFTARRKPA